MRAFLAKSFPAYPDLSGLPFPQRHDSRRAAGLQDSVLDELRGRHDARVRAVQRPRSTTCTRRTDDASIGPDTNWVQNADGTLRAAIRDTATSRWSATAARSGTTGSRRGSSTARRPTAAPGSSYTLSKTRSNTSTGLSTGGTTNPFDLNEDLGPDDNDRRHNFVLDGVLPGAEDRRAAGWHHHLSQCRPLQRQHQRAARRRSVHGSARAAQLAARGDGEEHRSARQQDFPAARPSARRPRSGRCSTCSTSTTGCAIRAACSRRSSACRSPRGRSGASSSGSGSISRLRGRHHSRASVVIH